MSILSIEHVSKLFGDRLVLDDVSCGIEKGEKIGREAAKPEALKRARDVLKDGLSLDKVAQYSGLSLQEIKNL